LFIFIQKLVILNHIYSFVAAATVTTAVVMQFDFVLDLFGLLEDFLNEMGELRALVEQPIRDVLKINRLGEIVDSDADDDGNLK
jgi:hypothetical protein